MANITCVDNGKLFANNDFRIRIIYVEMHMEFNPLSIAAKIDESMC